MKVSELIEFLRWEPQDALVVMSKDQEGNSYSPLSSGCLGSYEAANTWSGKWDDEPLPEGTAAVCLWPVN